MTGPNDSNTWGSVVKIKPGPPWIFDMSPPVLYATNGNIINPAMKAIPTSKSVIYAAEEMMFSFLER